MAAKRNKACQKAKNNKSRSPSTNGDKTREDDRSKNLVFRSPSQAPFSSIIAAMMSLLAAAIAIYVAGRQGHLPAGLSGGSFEAPPETQTLYNEKWGNFNGIATINNAYNVLKVLDHDETAFTQGLQVYQNQLIESTGNYAKSYVRIWDPHTGAIHKQTPILNEKYFGEGLTHYQDDNGNDRFILLTYQEQTAFIYDTNLNVINTFQYTTQTNEGWGITFDPIEKVFYVSDGSAYLQVWNLAFEEIRRVAVSYQVDPAAPNRIEIPHLNELERDPIDGTILANVWYQNVIIRIDPKNGQVLQIYDMTNLYTNRSQGADCLNGIAHQGGNRWWLTGKLWPNLYLVEFLE